MTISNFTKPELDYFKANCNFVNLELDVFELRSKGYTLEYIAEKLNISSDYARKISQRVNKKIIKVV
jgi:orotate phosphoribosyltransferase-like protein